MSLIPVPDAMANPVDRVRPPQERATPEDDGPRQMDGERTRGRGEARESVSGFRALFRLNLERGLYDEDGTQLYNMDRHVQA